MKTDDPWNEIRPPEKTGDISARRIPSIGSHEWGLYWAIDSQRHRLLILQHRSLHRPSHRLPKLRGLKVEVFPTEDEAGGRVVIRLMDHELSEVFLRFCLDIVDATHNSRSEREAIERFLVRAWRWHHLLRSGADGRLSEREQRGLIGELYVLERHLLSAIGAANAVQAWVGPLGAPKDFEIGWVSVEAKTRTPQVSTVRISTPTQLDSNETLRLFLHVTEVARAPNEAAPTLTVTDMVTRVRDTVTALDESAMVTFDERLNATGFDRNDDYSDHPWLIGPESIFEIKEGFPRITPAIVPPGVGDVRYVISLPSCEDFRVEQMTLAQALSGEIDGS